MLILGNRCGRCNLALGDNVKWRRTALGLTQAELARLVVIDRKHPDRSWICRLEQGRVDPRMSQVRGLAKALRVKPWQLVVEMYENGTFWERYLSLDPKHKREVQRMVQWFWEGRS